MYENLIISKSPLFTQNNVHYLCAENEEIKFLLDYQFEKADPFSILDNLPTEIQKTDQRTRRFLLHYCNHTS